MAWIGNCLGGKQVRIKRTLTDMKFPRDPHEDHCVSSLRWMASTRKQRAAHPSFHLTLLGTMCLSHMPENINLQKEINKIHQVEFNDGEGMVVDFGHKEDKWENVLNGKTARNVNEQWDLNGHTHDVPKSTIQGVRLLEKTNGIHFFYSKIIIQRWGINLESCFHLMNIGKYYWNLGAVHTHQNDSKV